MKKYDVIGLMSGTSLDGLDVALCRFTEDENQWTFKLIHAHTFTYDNAWRKKLSDALDLSAREFIKLDHLIGLDHSQRVEEFLLEHKLEGTIDLIVSHGQTVFHNPAENITSQIGDASIIAAESGIATVSDLRSLDIALKGQGAPIVPMGELHLFPSFDAYVNLGGICNVSLKEQDKIMTAFDVCPANGMLNTFAKQLDLDYDANGINASKGTVHIELLNQLNQVSYYQQTPPKTLDALFFNHEVEPIIASFDLTSKDALATCVEHIAIQLSQYLTNQRTLITGGGALNSYLIQRIKAHTSAEIILPEKDIIEFKEAIIIGFLGLLRFLKRPNILSSVTGATKDHIGGALYYPY